MPQENNVEIQMSSSVLHCKISCSMTNCGYLTESGQNNSRYQVFQLEVNCHHSQVICLTLSYCTKTWHKLLRNTCGSTRHSCSWPQTTKSRNFASICSFIAFFGFAFTLHTPKLWYEFSSTGTYNCKPQIYLCMQNRGKLCVRRQAHMHSLKSRLNRKSTIYYCGKR